MPKTKYGLCDQCSLLPAEKTTDFLFSNTPTNIVDLDLYIVCDFTKHKDSVIELLKSFPQLRYGLVNCVVCKHDGCDIRDAKYKCYGIVEYFRGQGNPKVCFIYDLDYENFPTEPYIHVSSPNELQTQIVKHLSLSSPVSDVKPKTEESNGSDELKYFAYSIPEKYYTDQYRLVDVQYINRTRKVVYIFRDKNNVKSFYEFPVSDRDFYWYESHSSNKIIEPMDNLKLVVGKFENRPNKSSRSYGADINNTCLHSVDYFLKNKSDCQITRQNIMFFDIETYQYHDRIFPDPSEAKYPIIAISFRTDKADDHVQVYVLNLKGEANPRINEIMRDGTYPNVTFFDNEKVMITAFCQKIAASDVDFISAWNSSGFDIPYVTKRMSNLNIDCSVLSPYGQVYADKTGRNSIAGYVVLDQLKLYKELTYITLPSYSLNNVAAFVLKKEKIQHAGMSIDEMYREDIDKFIQYSQVDTELIYEIENATKHIALQDELRRIATTSHTGASSTIGQAEGLYITSMKKKGLIARTYMHDAEKEKIPGAYVFDARGGLYEGLLCDLDYTSLYPSIVNTWNIGPDTFIGVVSEHDAFNYIFNKTALQNVLIEVHLDPIHANKVVKMNLTEFEALMSKYQAQITIAGTIFCGHDIYTGINYTVLTMLMNSRKVYKKRKLEAKEAKDDLHTQEYEAKQLAFKILANSLYGVLANEHFRFYNAYLAKSITLTGQEMLKYSTTHVDYYMLGKLTDDPSKFIIDFTFAEKCKNLTYVIYGDTDSMFIYLTDYLKKKNVPLKKCPEALAEIQKIQDFTNKIAIPKLLIKHGVQLKYSGMFLKNEYLFSKYYTLNGKKHYASKVIAQEGKDINEIDIKGLETKRSEIPIRSQQMLNAILDIILEDGIEKWQIKDRVDKLVAESRADMIRLIDRRDPSIARVISYSKDIEEYKSMPQHLKSMLIWNELAGREDFKHGSKGKMWNIMGVDVSKMPEEIKNNYYGGFIQKFKNTDLSAISVPEDVETLPAYFIVDSRKMIEYCCDDRAKNLLEPLWVESDQLMLF